MLMKKPDWAILPIATISHKGKIGLCARSLSNDQLGRFEKSSMEFSKVTKKESDRDLVELGLLAVDEERVRLPEFR